LAWRARNAPSHRSQQAWFVLATLAHKQWFAQLRASSAFPVADQAPCLCRTLRAPPSTTMRAPLPLRDLPQALCACYRGRRSRPGTPRVPWRDLPQAPNNHHRRHGPMDDSRSRSSISLPEPPPASMSPSTGSQCRHELAPLLLLDDL